MITNVGQIPLHGIRLLGQSRKEASKIGRFGTGLKEAIALCMRKGYEIAIWSGLDKIDFSVQNIDGQQEVCFKITKHKTDNVIYEGGIRSDAFASDAWHGMGFSPELGKADWNDDWQIFREIICNSIDEGDWAWGDTPEPGRTLVTLEGNYSGEIFKDIGNRILPLRKNYDKDARILRGSPGRVYHKGIMIKDLGTRTRDDGRTVAFKFAYNLPMLEITESRTCSDSDAYGKIGSAMSTCKDLSILMELFSDFDCGEWRTLDAWAYDTTDNKVARLAFTNTFGEHAIPVTKDNVEAHNKLIKKGYVPIIMPYSATKYCEKMGIRTWQSTLTFEETKGIEESTAPTGESCDILNRLWMELNAARLTKGKMKPSLKIFNPIASEGEAITVGMYRNGIVYISEKIVGSREERITMIEELAHHITGATDNSRDFQNWLIEALDVFIK